jgi:sulfite reductase (NADPH) hemoprotein beta-component
MIRENIGEATILEILGEQLGRFAKEREPGEHFGDFIHRAGYLRRLSGAAAAMRLAQSLP